MRKLLTILFLFAACALKAQYTPNSGAYSYKGLMPLKSLQLPTDCGYPVTAIHAPDSSRAAIYFDSCDALLYRFDPQPKTWSIVGGTGIDSLFITNTDSIFIISDGDTIFVGINDDGCTNGIKQPGYVTWSGDGLTFDVTAGFFTLDCTLYDGNAGSITLDPADPTFGRFDVIGWDTTGAVIKVTGTAGMNPAIPQVDPSYQIGLTVINIPAGATVPGGITQDVIYDENNEDWTGAVSGITVNLDNTTNPYHLTKSADAGTWSPAPKTLTFTNDTGYIDANDYGILKLFISLKESIAAVGNIRVSFLNDGDAVSNIVSLGGGVGFNKSIADTYQNISVPLSSFIFTSTVFNQVRITFAGSGDGAYIDYIQLQGGITPPSIAGVYQDTTYSRNDSLFGRKNNTEFFIQHLTLARLPQLWGIYINNDDSTYDPYGVDVGIGVDSALLKDWIINTVIDNDTTITNILDDIDYVVDTISNSPPVGAVNGDKVLVGTSPTGAFSGHANEVAELVGGVWTFTIPTTGESLQVRNSTQLLFYKFDGSNWNLISVGWIVGGNQGIIDPTIGVKDSTSVSVITNNIPAIVVDANQNVKLPMYSGLEDSSIYFRPGEDGKVDTGYFNQLIAGTGITITPGPNRTDTIKSTGGVGSLTWQQTLDNGSVLDKTNLIDGGGNYMAIDSINLQIIGRLEDNDSSFSVFTVHPETVSMAAGSNTIGSSIAAGKDSVTLVQSRVIESLQVNNSMRVTPEYILFHKYFPLGFDGSIDAQPKIIYPSDTLLTEPEFMYVSDNDTIKKYPYGGGGGSVTVEAGGNSGIDSNLVYDGGTFRKASPLGYLNIMDYGAVPDSSTDNYTAITAAIADLPDEGGIIFFPPGIYKVDQMITVDKAVTFQGAGCGSYPDFEWNPSTTKILTLDTDLKLFYTTVKNIKFKDMTIQNLATTPVAGGAGIYAEEGHGMQILSCMISGFYNNVQFVNAGEWTISDSYLTGMVNAAVVVRDSITPDDGDAAIVNCIIAARTRNANYGIYQQSAGGLRILNNKFNWGYEGVRIGWPYYSVSDGVTGNLHISNNSFENYTENAIYVDPNGVFAGNIVITGNQFQNLYAPSVRADIKLMTSMIGVSIVGNAFRTSVGSDTAIYIDFNISGIAVSNSYYGYDNPTIYGTNSINTLFDNNKIAQSVQAGVASYAPTATPLNISMGGTLYNQDVPVNTGMKIRLYNDGTDANTSGFGVTGSSTFNMFSWAADNWGNIAYVDNGVQAFRNFPSGRTAIGTSTTDDGANMLQVGGSVNIATTASGAATDSILTIDGSGNVHKRNIYAVGYSEASIASSATPSPTGSARENWLDITALAAGATFAAPSGTAVNHNQLIIRVKDNGGAQTLAWNAIYRAGTNLALPTTTTVSKTMYIKFYYNDADSKWDLVSVLDGL